MPRFGVVFLYLFLTNEQLGLTSQLAYTVVGGILLFSAAWYIVAKRIRRNSGIDVDLRVQGDPAGVSHPDRTATGPDDVDRVRAVAIRARVRLRLASRQRDDRGSTSIDLTASSHSSKSGLRASMPPAASAPRPSRRSRTRSWRSAAWIAAHSVQPTSDMII